MKKAWISLIAVHILFCLVKLVHKYMIKIGEMNVARVLSGVAVWLSIIVIVIDVWYLIKKYQ